MASMQFYKPADQTRNHQGVHQYGHTNDDAMTKPPSQRFPLQNRPHNHFENTENKPHTHFGTTDQYPNLETVHTETYYESAGQYPNPNHGMAKTQMVNCVDYETKTHGQYTDQGMVNTQSQYYKEQGLVAPQKHHMDHSYGHHAPAGAMGCFRKKEKNMFRKKSGGGCSSGSDSD